MTAVIVCGGRDFKDKDFVFKVLDEVHKEVGISVVIHGGATGADYIAHRWARSRKINEIEMPADWETHGRAAGPMRNSLMLATHTPDMVVAFEGGNGTKDMVTKAKKAGVEVREMRNDE